MVALRGYDRDQVDDFLRELAQAFRDALAAAEYTSKHAGSTSQERRFENLGAERAIIARTAAQAARDIRAAAEEEAAVRLATAEREAARLEQAAAKALREAERTRAGADAAAAAQLARACEEAAALKADATQGAATARSRAEKDASRFRYAASRQLRKAENAAKGLAIEAKRQLDHARRNLAASETVTVRHAADEVDVASLMQSAQQEGTDTKAPPMVPDRAAKHVSQGAPQGDRGHRA